MTNLIEGINPLVISKITMRRGRRRGRHPYHTKLIKRKYPFRKFFLITGDDVWFEYWESAEVSIRGADGDEIRYIKCKSNAAAEALRDKLQAELEAFLTDIRAKGLK
jgi:hypothetical protein